MRAYSIHSFRGLVYSRGAMNTRFSGLVGVFGVWVGASYSGEPGAVFEEFGTPFHSLRSFDVAGVTVMLVRYAPGRPELGEPSAPAWWAEDRRYGGRDPFRPRRGPFETAEAAQAAAEAWMRELSSAALAYGVHGVDDVRESEDVVRMRRWRKVAVGAEIDPLVARWAFERGLPVFVPGKCSTDGSYRLEDYVPATREDVDSFLHPQMIDRSLASGWKPYVKGAARAHKRANSQRKTSENGSHSQNRNHR